MFKKTKKEDQKKTLLRSLTETAMMIAIALLASFLLNTFLIRSFYIPSASMQNTLQVNDHVLVNKLVPKVVALQRGDIVVFDDPGGWLVGAVAPPANPVQKVLQKIGIFPDATDNKYLIKRVIGVAGDRIQCCGASGKLKVNGVEIDEPYAVIPAGQTRVSAVDFDVTVPAGHIWVMGDNRYDSRDSRYNQDQPTKGFVPVENIVGRAFLLTYPFNRLTILGNYPETFSRVPPAEGGSAAAKASSVAASATGANSAEQTPAAARHPQANRAAKTDGAY
ncbi:signal peptidase I [Canibacter zhuwentaonis]|uniref:signal peptidase I n=1 Tax=Canibacter zhuwentaonis TaxID=2837491 RepID=UPI0035107761